MRVELLDVDAVSDFTIAGRLVLSRWCLAQLDGDFLLSQGDAISLL